MHNELDLEPLLDHIEREVMPEWVIQKDRRRELRAQGKAFDSTGIDDLNAILELFYEKECRKGLEAYIDWIMKVQCPMASEDVAMLARYGRQLGLEDNKIDAFSAAYEDEK